LLGRASKKHLCSQAAAELLISLWDNDHAQLKALLKQHLLSNFPFHQMQTAIQHSMSSLLSEIFLQ